MLAQYKYPFLIGACTKEKHTVKNTKLMLFIIHVKVKGLFQSYTVVQKQSAHVKLMRHVHTKLY